MKTFFVDIDGTIADTESRSRVLTDHRYNNGQRWAQFFQPKAMEKDPILPQSRVLDRLLGGNYDVTFVTARPEKVRQSTVGWLQKHFPHFNAEQHAVVMKPNDSAKSSATWKAVTIAGLGGEDNFVFIDNDKTNRSAVRRSFPFATVLDPESGWDLIGGQLDDDGDTENTDEPTVEDEEIDVDTSDEDYSNLD